MGNWKTEWGKCREEGWEWDECDGNAGGENKHGNAGNLGENTNNMEIQGGDAGN